jgi:hypothetical protein
MKSFLNFINSIYALILVVFAAGISAQVFGLPIKAALVSLLVASVFISFIPQRKGVLSAGILKEMFTGEVIKYITTAMKATFLDGIEDFSKYVAKVDDEMQVINLAAMNVLPDVLINNTTYPIGYQELGVTPVAITLDKFQTKATPITRDEMYASSVKKIELVKDRHGKALLIKQIRKAIHAFAPGSNTTAMPVLITTGPDDGTGRKRMLWEDVLALKTQADELELENRRLVLCNEHVNDLILLDKDFKALFYNRKDGKIFSQLDFDIFDYVGNPYYNPATKTKLSFGAVPAATDRKASVFFSTDRTAKAIGWTEMYEDKPDTQMQRYAVNFRQNAIYLPTAEEARGAIVSGNTP